MPWQTFEPSRRKIDQYYYECLEPYSPAMYIIIDTKLNTLEVKFNNNPQGQGAIDLVGSQLVLLDKVKSRYLLENYNMHLHLVVAHIVGSYNTSQQLLDLINETIPQASPWKRTARDPAKPLLTVKFDEEGILQTTGLTARIRKAKGIMKSSPLSRMQYTAGDSDDDCDEEDYADACSGEEQDEQDVQPSAAKNTYVI